MTVLNPRPEDDFFSERYRVSAFPEKACSACDDPFAPLNKWEKRCQPCRIAGKQAEKSLANPGYTGVKTPPPGIRFYPSGKGTRYPSVTSILHPEGIDFPKELLEQYAARGTLIHRKVELFLKEGKYPSLKDMWLRFRDIRDTIDTLKKGSLKLDHTKCNWPGFYKEHGARFTFDEVETLLVNHEHEYAGRTDAIGTFDGMPAIIDFKTASDYNKDKLAGYFMQLSAYAGATGVQIEALVVIPLNPKSPVGYDAPLVSTGKEVDKHFAKFLTKRRELKEKYGI